MSMTRKHFRAIADAVAEARRANDYDTTEPTAGIDAVDDVARNLADSLRQFNPSFDRARFLEACGVED